MQAMPGEETGYKNGVPCLGLVFWYGLEGGLVLVAVMLAGQVHNAPIVHALAL